MDISLYEAISLGIMGAGSCVFEITLPGQDVSFFGTEELPVVNEHFLGTPLRANSSFR